MKIVIINKSDLIGGAAVVSYRLMNALRNIGVDARMIVLDKVSNDDNVLSVKKDKTDKTYFLLERLGIFTNNGFSRENLFKVSTALWGRSLASHPWIQEADVVALNWINQGMLSIKGIEEIAALGKPLIWTMHDMWECTGICHHAFECSRYKLQCGSCAFLGSHKEKDLSTKVQKLKKKLYDKTDIHFVAVSNWLAERCRESALLGPKSVSVIHNAFPIEDFDYNRRNTPLHDIPTDKKVIVMGAARLDDPIKGFEYLIESLDYIARNKPELAKKLHLILYGNIRDVSLLDKIAIPYTFIGRVNGIIDLVDIYTHSDIVISTSFYETLPGTLIEGQASGCIPVTFGNGGQRDIVEHLISGYIAKYKDAGSIAEGIEWAVQAQINRKELHESVRAKFSAEKIANDYLTLFNNLITNKKTK